MQSFITTNKNNFSRRIINTVLNFVFTIYHTTKVTALMGMQEKLFPFGHIHQ
jgi:hypothetical protein